MLVYPRRIYDVDENLIEVAWEDLVKSHLNRYKQLNECIEYFGEPNRALLTYD